MRFAENIEKVVKHARLNIGTNAAVDAFVRDNLLMAQKEATKGTRARRHAPAWRIVMKHRITGYAAVVVVIGVIVLTIGVLNGTTGPAYALEQSLNAYHTVRTVQVKVYNGQGDIENDRCVSAWVQYDDMGRLLHSRMEIPRAKDGTLVRISNKGQVRHWDRKANFLLISPGDPMAERLEEFARECDPMLTVQRLHDGQEEGSLELEITEPEEGHGLILLQVTYPDKEVRLEYVIDTHTKLLQQVRSYALNEGRYELEEKIVFVAYNQPIEASLFELGDIPGDALIVDKAGGEMGLSQGDLTDAEIAIKVARECLKATIAQDYDKAKRLMGGMPGNTLETIYGGRILRIVSVGQPEPSERFPRGLCVPCRIEVENEKGKWIADFRPPVQRTKNQPDRWIIDDGSFDFDGGM